MSGVPAASISAVSARPARGWLPIAAVVLGIVAAVAAALEVGSEFGATLFVGVVVVALGLWAVRSPINATLLLLVTMFLLLPLRSLVHLPKEPFKIVLVLLVVSTALWVIRVPGRLRGIGGVELAMLLYLLWNASS